MANKKHNNGHRKDKHAFQAMLTSEQKETLEKIKTARGIKKNTDLLAALLTEEAIRIL